LLGRWQWAPYVVVALLERNDYDTLLAKQQLDPHSFLYNYQRVYPQVPTRTHRTRTRTTARAHKRELTQQCQRSLLLSFSRFPTQRRNTYRTDPPKEQSETEIKWTDQDFTLCDRLLILFIFIFLLYIDIFFFKD